METPSSTFESIFNVALSDYAKQTGIDLATHPFTRSLQNCSSTDAILHLLQDKAQQFQAYRDGNRKLINSLKPVVQVLHVVSSILGEAVALVSPKNCVILSNRLPPHGHIISCRSNLHLQSSLGSMSSSP
jgi:hypothetical protein